VELAAQSQAFEDLEKSIKDISEGQRTPEKMDLQTKLVRMRQELQSKVQKVQEKADSLSTDAIYYKQYEQTVEKLEPLLQRMDAAVVVAGEKKKLKCDNSEGILQMLAKNKVRHLF